MKSIIYISSSIIFYNFSSLVLIAKRSANNNSFPGMWETVGGGLEFGESPEECIRREVWEELNCGIEELELFGVYSWVDSERQIISIVYTGEPAGEIQPNPDEIEEIKWIDSSQIEEYDFCINCKRRLFDFFARPPKEIE